MHTYFTKYHIRKYPKMTYQDIEKLILQENNGPIHLLNNNSIIDIKSNILLELKENYLDTDLYDALGCNYVRVNLHKYYSLFNDIDTLIDLFKQSISESTDTSYTTHSLTFKENYLPHYLLIKYDLINLDLKVMQLKNFINRCKNKSIIAIEGKAGSGKSTISSKLSDCSVISTDDFFLPKNSRTKDRLNEVGGNINYELIKSTLINLKEAINKNNTTFTYKAYDCSSDSFYKKEITITNHIILEGVYSTHKSFIDYIDYIVYLYVDEKTQHDRLSKRINYQRFVDVWLKLEDKYFDSFDILDICDLII